MTDVSFTDSAMVKLALPSLSLHAPPHCFTYKPESHLLPETTHRDCPGKPSRLEKLRHNHVALFAGIQSFVRQQLGRQARLMLLKIAAGEQFQGDMRLMFS